MYGRLYGGPMPYGIKKSGNTTYVWAKIPRMYMYFPLLNQAYIVCPDRAGLGDQESTTLV